MLASADPRRPPRGSFGPAASDLEELFLQITDADRRRHRTERMAQHAAEAQAMTAVATGAADVGGRSSAAASRRFWSGISAVRIKELRGRMRGRRAFVVLTIYLLLLGLFSFAIYVYLKQQAAQAASTNSGPGFPGRTSRASRPPAPARRSPTARPFRRRSATASSAGCSSSKRCSSWCSRRRSRPAPSRWSARSRPSTCSSRRR